MQILKYATNNKTTNKKCAVLNIFTTKVYVKVFKRNLLVNFVKLVFVIKYCKTWTIIYNSLSTGLVKLRRVFRSYVFL